MERCTECRKWINRHNAGHKQDCERGKRMDAAYLKFLKAVEDGARNPKPSSANLAPKTFWNGEPCSARIVRVIVGKPLAPTWWCADLEGTEREAVEVRYGNQLFYLDNENEQGWLKVTLGMGSPRYGHRSLLVERVLEGL